jgi:UDP-GlcNAc:undecaprenyl-phosphate GlcNAc-1-phosphate transferase
VDVIIIKIFFSFLFSFLFSFYLTPLLCALAQRLQFVDRPDGVIKMHQYAVPYLGGVAVYGGFLGALALIAPFDSNIFLLIIGTTLLLLIGLVDDLIILKAYQKFFGQLIVALCFLRAGFYLKYHIFYNFWNFPLSLLWILSVINAFNLVDVMDGLATLLAIVATLTFIIIAAYLQNNVVLSVLMAFLGALVAFFWYNKPPARIYLGDAGSLFVGGFLATVPFLLDWGTYNMYGFLTPPIVLGIPLLEGFSLILIRSYKRIPFYKGSPHHFSSYLLANKWTKEKILGYIFFLSLYSGLMAFLFTVNILSIGSIAVAGLLFLIVWIAVLLKK